MRHIGTLSPGNPSGRGAPNEFVLIRQTFAAQYPGLAFIRMEYPDE